MIDLRTLVLSCAALVVCGPALAAQDQDADADSRPGIAVLRFEYAGSYGTNPMDLGALEVGLQQMLLTELSQNEDLRIVERGQLNAIIAEQNLGQSGRVAEGTEPEVGRLVGARYMVAGSFLDVDGQFRMDARIVDTETADVVRSVDVSDDREQVYNLVIDLAVAIMSDLALPGLDSATVSERHERAIPPEAIVMFAWAQSFEDRGDKGLAADTYQRIMQLYPDLSEAKDNWLRLRGNWEIGLSLGTLNDEPEFAYSQDDEDDFRRSSIVGIRAGYHLPYGFAVEAELGQSLIFIRRPVQGLQDSNTWPFMTSLEWNYDLTHDFQGFVGGGLGFVHFSPDVTPSETNFAYNLRAGGRLFLTRNHAVRFDARYIIIPDPLKKTIADLGLEPNQTSAKVLELSVGFSWFPSG